MLLFTLIQKALIFCNKLTVNALWELWEQEVASSNLATPTKRESVYWFPFFVFKKKQMEVAAVLPKGLLWRNLCHTEQDKP